MAKRKAKKVTTVAPKQKRKYTRRIKPETPQLETTSNHGLSPGEIAFLKSPYTGNQAQEAQSPIEMNVRVENMTPEERTLGALIECNRVAFSMLHLFHNDMVLVLNRVINP